MIEEDSELRQIREKMAKEIRSQNAGAPVSAPAEEVQHPVDLKTSEFDGFLAQHPRVVVDLWAAWCGPCRALSPVLDELARTMAGSVSFAKVNVDEEPALAARFGVQSIPTVLGFQNGRLVERWMGARSRPDMEMLIRRALLGKATTIRFADR
jgi:thioredoxin